MYSSLQNSAWLEASRHLDLFLVVLDGFLTSLLPVRRRSKVVPNIEAAERLLMN